MSEPAPATPPARPYNLRTPGPTPLPPEVREALARDMINHRGPEFRALFHRVEEGLQWALRTKNPVIMLTSSGSGGLESTVVNLLSPGQKVLMATIGGFGDRFGATARAFGANVVELKSAWGKAADTNAIVDALKADREIETLFITHNETSTGVTNPIEEISRAARDVRPDLVLAVDAISSAASIPLETDGWDCDVVIAGSQKGWMIPPGLCFLTLSERALERHKQATMPRFYWDWAPYLKELKGGSTPATPAVGLIFAVEASLQRMREEGLEAIYQRHKELAAYTRESLTALGCSLIADPAYASWTVTPAYPPEGVSTPALLDKLLTTYNIELAGGQGPLTDKAFRVGHLGYVKRADLEPVFEALEAELPAPRKVTADASV